MNFKAFSNEKNQSNEGISDVIEPQTVTPNDVDKVAEHSWTDVNTRSLIASVSDRMESFADPKIKDVKLWRDVVTDLGKMGIIVTAKQCKNKWDNLKKRYKSIKDNAKQTGRGYLPFKFMADMENVLGNRPGTSCSHTISSMENNPVHLYSPENEKENEVNFQADNESLPSSRVSDSSNETPEKSTSGKKRKHSEANTFDSFVRSYFNEKAERAEEERNARDKFRADMIALEQQKIELMRANLEKK